MSKLQSAVQSYSRSLSTASLALLIRPWICASCRASQASPTATYSATRALRQQQRRAYATPAELPSFVQARGRSQDMSSGLPHEERTAGQAREVDVHAVVVQAVQQVTPNVRLIRLSKTSATQEIRFHAGQWIDLFIPGIRHAGGFTITSAPRDVEGPKGYIELAIQHSNKNPSAAWLWQDDSAILQHQLQVRAGGNFIWPPPGIDLQHVDKLVFVAGGVGINPLMSILSHLHQTSTLPPHIRFLYSSRQSPRSSADSTLLFKDRLLDTLQSSPDHSLQLYLTPSETDSSDAPGQGKAASDRFHQSSESNVRSRRIAESDLAAAVGSPAEASRTVAYVCGPPGMTDWAVATLAQLEGMESKRVLCEKWW